MKARVKATGEILYDIIMRKDNNGFTIVSGYDKDGECVSLFPNRIEFIEDSDGSIDWDAKLIELSGMAMQGMACNCTEYNDDEIASMAIELASVLIKKLKKELK